MGIFNEGQSVSQVETLRKGALGQTDQFVRKYSIHEMLGLKHPLQREIFRFHFASYLLLKQFAEAGYLARRPESEALAKIPVLGKGARKNIEANDASHTASQELIQLATDKAESLVQETVDTAYKMFAESEGLNESELRQAMPPDNPEFQIIIREFIQDQGSPNAIQRAANLVSTICLEEKGQKKDAVKFRIARALASQGIGKE
jgi:hypothetical protein